jgi:hypothetical protein
LRQLFEARVCLGCGVRFRPRHRRQFYHDRKCRQASDNRRNPVVRLRRDQMIVRKPRPRAQKPRFNHVTPINSTSARLHPPARVYGANGEFSHSRDAASFREVLRYLARISPRLVLRLVGKRA